MHRAPMSCEKSPSTNAQPSDSPLLSGAEESDLVGCAAMVSEPQQSRRFFISHSSKQKDIALEIKAALDGDAWVDLHEIDVGDVLLSEISAGIEAATDFVLLWTADSAASRWVEYELHMAFMRYLEDRAISLRVIRLDSTAVPLFLRPLLQARETTDAHEIAEVLRGRPALRRVLRSFVNRGDHMTAVEKALYSADQGFVFFHGIPGVGKRAIVSTALDRYVADTTRRIALEVRPGTGFVELHLALVAALGLSLPEPTLREVQARGEIERIMTILTRQGTLWSFSNVQHWLDEDAEPNPVFEVVLGALASGDVQTSERLCFFTSTRRPKLPHYLSPLAVVRHVIGLEEPFAVAMLRERHPEASEILLRQAAGELDGHPLALTLVGSDVDESLSITGLEGLRAQTAEAILSEIDLSDDARRILESLAVIDGPLPGAAIASHLSLTAEAFVEAVAVATSFSLVHEEAGFLRIHPLVREWYLRTLRGRSDYVATVNDLADRSRDVLEASPVGSEMYIASLFATFRLLSWSGRLQEALELHANLFGSLMEVALQLYNERRYELALRYFDAVIESTELNRPAQLYRARTLAQLGRTSEARQLLDSLIADAPDDFRLIQARGRVEFILRQWGLARDWYETARDLRPRSVAVLRDLGQVYIRLGQWERAREALERARDLQDLDAFTAFYYSQVLEHDREFAEAEKVMRVAVQLEPARAFFHHRLGRIALAQDNRDVAKHEFERAVSLEPGFGESLVSLASLSIDLGDLARADELLEQARETRSVREALIKTVEAKALLRRSRLDEAEQRCEEALAHEREPESLLLLLRILVRRSETHRSDVERVRARIDPVVRELAALGLGDEAERVRSQL